MLRILECVGRFVKLGGNESGDVGIDEILVVRDEAVMNDFGAQFDFRINLVANDCG